jgi:predicted ArsR family transcriptional regulator
MARQVKSAPSPDRILFQLKTLGPQTASDVATRLGMTATGARQHLAKLESAGLIEGDDQRQRRGRPKKIWRLTESGHARFPDRHSELTLELIRATEAVFGAKGLARLIAHRERKSLACYREKMADRRSLRDKLSALAEIRSSEGYMASFLEQENGTFLFIEDHCPICAAATACQGLCRSELAIFRKVLGDDTNVERIDHIAAGARRCAYRVSGAAQGKR